MAKQKKRSRTPNVPRNTQPTAAAKASSSPSRRASQRQRRERRNWLMLAGVSIVAIALVAVVILFNNASQTAGAPPVTDLPADVVVFGASKGPEDAQVVVAEFSDFQCPHCKTFAQGAAKQLDEEYVKTGLIRFEYNFFPLTGFEPGATRAANAAACAADQGKFWEMHDYLFQEQGKEGPNTFTQARLRNMGQELGLDNDQFSRCLSREEHRQDILDDLNEGRQLGVTGTPSVFVNGQKVDSTYAAIKAAIDAELAAQ